MCHAAKTVSNGVVTLDARVCGCLEHFVCLHVNTMLTLCLEVNSAALTSVVYNASGLLARQP